MVKRKQIESVDPSAYFHLAPTDDAKDCDAYLDALSWALSQKENIKNIAISGAYGSGKSSVIQTYFKKYPEQGEKAFTISLATFQDNKTDEDSQQNKTELTRLIELSILQQLFYHEKDEKIPNSRFKKIKHQKWYKTLLMSLFSVGFGLTVFNLFFPELFLRLSGIETKDVSKWIILPPFYAGLIIIVYQIIKSLKNISVKKFCLNSAEIEIDNGISKSILNNHIDEIIYFFEATNYNIVVIEDLDRFEQTDIFTKLREINLLINNSKKIQRNIIFIYAIKDDMFLDKERTKFFDFMLPIIPVINSSNSETKLRKIIEDNSYEIDNEIIDDLSLFIDDMRLLYNIMNEFHIYNKKLSKHLDRNKLLAMIVYKNLCPKDFAQLPENSGNLYKIINGKAQYIQDAIAEYDEKIGKLKIRINKAVEQQLTNLKELRVLYLVKIMEKIGINFYSFKYDGKSVSISDFTSDECFESLKNGTLEYTFLEKHPYDDFFSLKKDTLSFNFSEIENLVDPKRSYNEREKLILDKGKLNYKEQLNQLKTDLEKLNSERDNIQKSKLKDLLVNNKIEVDANYKKSELLDILLRNGYIDENYMDYISIFHEGTISKNDHQFLMNVKRNVKTPFDFTLSKTDDLIKKIGKYDFEKEYVLNHNLLDAILKSNSFIEKKKALLQQLANEQEVTVEFIDAHLTHTTEIELFIKELCANWHNFWRYINLSNYTDEKKETYFKLIIKHAKIKDVSKIFDKNDSYIANYAEFLKLDIDHQRRDKIIEFLSIKFEKIAEDSPKDGLKYLLEKNYYTINIGMLKTLIPAELFNTNDFYSKNYSFILNSKIEPMVKYITDNIEAYVESVWLKLENNSEEDEQHFVELLNNCNLTSETKEKIIKQTNTIITDISCVEDLNVCSLLFKFSKIKALWENVLVMFEEEENILSDEVIEFLNTIKNAEILSSERMTTEKNADGICVYSKLCNAIIHAGNLTNEEYRLLTKAVPWCYTSFEAEKLTIERIKILIENNKVNSIPPAYKFLRENFDDTHITLLEKYGDKFKDSLTEIAIDSEDLALILTSQKISESIKIKCIHNASIDDIINNVESSTFVIKRLLNATTLSVADELILLLMKKKELPVDDRINLFIAKRDLLNHNEIRLVLLSLGGEYAVITNNSKQALLEHIELNEALLNELKELDYISSFKKEGKGLRVFHKRIER